LCLLGSGVLSATALATVYKKEIWDEFGDNLLPTKIFVIELIWDRVYNFNLACIKVNKILNMK